MDRKNGAPAKHAWLPLEVCQKLIVASRERQGKPAQLTAGERRLTRVDCERLLDREREAEAAFNKAQADKEHIKRLWCILAFEIFLFAAGVGVWLLANADWLPEGFVTRDNKIIYLVIAGIALVSGTHSFLDLRATRLGTDRARKHFNVFQGAGFSLFIVACVLGIGAILAVIGAIVHNAWLTGQFGPTDYLMVLVLTMVLFKFLAFLIIDWIEGLENAAGVISALIAIGLLLTAYVLGVVHHAWSEMAARQDTPLWWTPLIATFLLLWAWPLWWAAIASALKLRTLLAERRAKAS